MRKYENDGEKYLTPLEICIVSYTKLFFLVFCGIIFIFPLIRLIANRSFSNDATNIIGFSFLALLGVFLIAFSIIFGKTYLSIDNEKICLKNKRINRTHYWVDMNNLDVQVIDNYRGLLPRFYITTSYMLYYNNRNGDPKQFAFDLHRKKFDKRIMKNTIWYLYNRYK